MAFDATTARLEDSGGFDPSTARPLAQITESLPTSPLGELGRQAGLTGRYLAEGAMALPNLPFDAGVRLWNLATGSSMKPPSQSQSEMLTRMGFPQPQTGTERVVGDVSRALVPTGGSIKLAQNVAEQASGPVARGVASLLAQAPAMQAVSAATGASASGAAREAGASPGGQYAASLLAGAAPSLAFAPAAIRAARPVPPLTNDAQARAAAMASIGIDNPPRPAVTRSPEDWAKWQELGKQDGPAKALFVSNGERINSQLESILPRMQVAPESTPYARAEAAREGVAAYRADAKDVASGTYKAAETAPGSDVPLSWEHFYAGIAPPLERYSDVIPGAVANRIKSFAPQEITHTLEQPPQPPQPPQLGKRLSSRLVELGGLNKQEASDTLGETGQVAARLRPGLFQTSQALGVSGTRKGNSLSTLVHDGQLNDYLPFNLRGPGSEDEAVDFLRGQLQSDVAGQHVGPYENMMGRNLAGQEARAIGRPQMQQEVTYGAPFNVGEMSKLYQLINDRMGRASGAAAPAGAELKQAIAEYGSTLPGEPGTAMQLFKDATQQWRTMKGNLSPTPIQSLSRATEANPRFLSNLFTNGKPEEIASLSQLLRQNVPQAADAVHDGLLGYLQDKATSAASGRFSGAQLGKAMDRVGPERLAAVLSPGEIQNLQSLRTAAEALTVEPNLSSVNHSNTASAIRNLMTKAHVNPAGVGLLGEILGQHSGIPGAGGLLGFGAGMIGNRIAGNIAGRRMAQIYGQQQPGPSLQDLMPWMTGASAGATSGLGR